MLTSNLIQMTFDDKNAVFGKAMIVACDRTSGIKETAMYRTQIAGAIITDVPIPKLDDGNFNMIECDIILLPKKVHKKFRLGEGHKFSSMLTLGYEKEDNWLEHDIY